MSSYCNFAYSVLAAMKKGMSGSASFHSQVVKGVNQRC